MCETSVTDAPRAGRGRRTSRSSSARARTSSTRPPRTWRPSSAMRRPPRSWRGRGCRRASPPRWPSEAGDKGAAWALGQGLTDAIFRQTVAHWAPLRAASARPRGSTTSAGSRERRESSARRTASTCPLAWTSWDCPGADAAIGTGAPQALADARARRLARVGARRRGRRSAVRRRARGASSTATTRAARSAPATRARRACGTRRTPEERLRVYPDLWRRGTLIFVNIAAHDGPAPT